MQSQSGHLPSDVMKRFRLSALMLLIVITALLTALLVQHERASRREAQLQDQLEEARYL